MTLPLQIFKYKNSELPFYQKGERPQIFLISGIHGDEASVIEPLQICIEKFQEQLPGFIFIPQASPSAVLAKSRENQDGMDLNRCFYPESTVAEAQVIMQLLSQFTFQFGVTFHEDRYQDAFYMYDSGGDLQADEKLEPFLTQVKNLDIPLLNGLDDPDDPALGFEFINGYRSFQNTACIPYNGMLEVWAIVAGVSKRVLNPETPTSLPVEKKQALIEVIFKEIVIPLGGTGGVIPFPRYDPTLYPPKFLGWKPETLAGKPSSFTSSGL